MDKKRVAGFALFRQFDLGIEYLMLQSTKVGNDWSPPKGQLEDGEDEFAAALRETQEEVGYTMDDLEIYRDQKFTVEQYLKMKAGETKTVTFFLARLKNTGKIPVLSTEHCEYRWVNKEQALSLYGALGEFADMLNQFDSKISNK